MSCVSDLLVSSVAMVMVMFAVWPGCKYAILITVRCGETSPLQHFPCERSIAADLRGAKGRHSENYGKGHDEAAERPICCCHVVFVGA